MDTKKTGLMLLPLLLLFIIYSTCVWILFKIENRAFFVTYISSVIIFGIVAAVTILSIARDKNIDQTFLSIPSLLISYITLFIQILISVIVSAINPKSVGWVLVIEIVFTGLYAILVILLSIAKNSGE